MLAQDNIRIIYIFIKIKLSLQVSKEYFQGAKHISLVYLQVKFVTVMHNNGTNKYKMPSQYSLQL